MRRVGAFWTVRVRRGLSARERACDCSNRASVGVHAPRKALRGGIQKPISPMVRSGARWPVRVRCGLAAPRLLPRRPPAGAGVGCDVSGLGDMV